MANGTAGIAIVRSVVHPGVIERRLENARGEVDVVHLRIEVGIHGGRRHAPFSMVHRLADLVEVAMALELAGALNIAQVIAARDLH